MGANKELFMQDRESELYEVQSSTHNPLDQLSDAFLKQADEYDNGNIDALETAILMRKDYEKLEIQMNLRKTWIDENKESIESESSKYPEGFKGYKVSIQTKSTPNFKSIPEWIKLEKDKKDFEAKSKLAYQMVQKGGANVDADGVEIPLPEMSVTSFIKFDKVK